MSLGRDGAWLYGQVDQRIAKVELRRRDGTSSRLDPTQGFVLVHLGVSIENASAELREAVGFDASSDVVGKQRFEDR